MSGDELAAYVQRRRVETAYHEAGHAVAAVLRGGVVHHLRLGDITDAGLVDADRNLVGVTRHTSASYDIPFVAFAGPWAQWRHGTETGDDDYDTDLSDWLELDDDVTGRDDPHRDYLLMDYDNLSDAQVDVWTRELEWHWPTITAVAALALAGEGPVVHAATSPGPHHIAAARPPSTSQQRTAACGVPRSAALMPPLGWLEHAATWDTKASNTNR